MLVILLDPKKVTSFIVHVTNAHDKECLADVTKALITSKTILTESKLETVQNLTWLSMTWNNSVNGIPCMYIAQRLLCIYTNKLKQLRIQRIAPLSKRLELFIYMHIHEMYE